MDASIALFLAEVDPPVSLELLQAANTSISTKAKAKTFIFFTAA